MPDAIAQQFDDMRRLLGTVIGQNNDLMQEAEKRRSYEVDLPPNNPRLRRIEDLLRRALLNLGDSDIAEEMGRTKRHEDDDDDEGYPFPRQASSFTKASSQKEGSWYHGGDSVYSEELNPKLRAPHPSEASTLTRNRGAFTPVPESLLHGSVGEPDFDEDWAMQNLVPETPPSDYIPPRNAVPPHLTDHLRTHKQKTPEATPRSQHRRTTPSPPPGSVYTEDLHPESEGDDAAQEEEQGDQPPVPYRHEEDPQDDESIYTEDEYRREPARRLPTPQPVDLPTPVNSKQGFPPYPPGPPQSMRPPYPGGGMPPMRPGMAEMPRPSLPRIAGVRDPISTT